MSSSYSMWVGTETTEYLTDQNTINVEYRRDDSGSGCQLWLSVTQTYQDQSTNAAIYTRIDDGTSGQGKKTASVAMTGLAAGDYYIELGYHDAEAIYDIKVYSVWIT